MLKNLLIAFFLIIFGLGVLFISIIYSISPHYRFSNVHTVIESQVPSVDFEYNLPYPGILPDSPLWPLKAARDKVWLFLTPDPYKKSQLLLLFADKRIVAARILVDERKFEIGVTTATKAEKYLEEAVGWEEKARKKGADTGQLLEELAKADVVHWKILEEIHNKVQEEARPIVVLAINYPRRLWPILVSSLLEKGRTIPPNPFD